MSYLDYSDSYRVENRGCRAGGREERGTGRMGPSFQLKMVSRFGG